MLRGLLLPYPHVNEDTLLNTRQNLRLVDKRGNNVCRNLNRTFKGQPTSSRFKGVSWNGHSKAWQSSIGYDYRSIHLGLFKEERDAATAYDLKAKELFGECAWLNFPQKEDVVGHAA